MDPAILSVLIIVIALVLFLVPKIPIALTSILCMVAMPLFGLTSYSSTFGGFGNQAVLLIAGMAVVAQGLVDTGIAQKIGTLVMKMTRDSEAKFILFCLIFGCALSSVINGALVVAILLPICDSLVISSKGKITRKHCYLPIGLTGPMGNNLTAISASSMVTCVGVMVDAGYRGLSVFEPTLIALPALILTIVVYMLVIYPLSKKWLDYPDPEIEGFSGVVDTTTEEYKAAHPVWKQIFVLVVLVGAIAAMICKVNWGAASLVAACLVVLAGCVSGKRAISCISWSTVIIAAASIGFSAGLKDSGGGALVAEWLVGIAGPLGKSPFGMCVVMFIVANIISQVMSDSGSVACTVPITISIATTMGWDPVPLIIATAMGVKVALATPMCVSCVTMAAPGGYRFKDYLKIGGLVTLAQTVGILVMIAIVYYI